MELKDFNKETPIFYAVFNNNIKVLELLIKTKVDINAKNKYGLSPIMIAEKNHF